jgi:primosomal protein N' (replication factor Y)
VLIQTNSPTHSVFQFVLNNDVAAFLENQIADRNANYYPPLNRLIQLTFKHSEKSISLEAAAWYAAQARKVSNITTLGPTEPIVSKIRNEYLQSILIKIPRSGAHLQEIKKELLAMESSLNDQNRFRRVKVLFDVDPN